MHEVRAEIRVPWLALGTRALVGVAALGAATGLLVFLVQTRSAPAINPPEARIVSVEAVRASEVPVRRTWEGYGTARAMTAVDVSAQVSGRLIDRPEGIDDGVRVSRGQVLALLDQSDFQQRVVQAQAAIRSSEAALLGLDVEMKRLGEQIEQAEEELKSQRWELDQARALSARAAGSEIEIQQRRVSVARLERVLSGLSQSIELIPSRRGQLNADLARERADLALAKLSLDRARITSPIDGFIQSVNAEEGELVSVGMVVARVVDLRVIEVPLRMPISSRATISVGDAVVLTADGPTSGRWTGRIARIAPEADEATRTIAVFVEVRQEPDSGADGIESPAGLLLPGQFVIGRVTATEAQARIIVPRSCVEDDRVLVAEATSAGGFVARSTPVHVLYHLDGSYPTIEPVETQWAVLGPGDEGSDGSGGSGGVGAGQLVITTNLDDLKDGVSVSVKVVSETGR